MKVYRHPFTQLNSKTSVALGFFDGVHAGHSAVISNAVEYAKENGLTSVVWTFDSSPKKAPVITDEHERRELFEKMGVDILITFPFDDSVKSIVCEDFAKRVLKDCLNAQKVFCGFNYSFGAGGKGNPEKLKILCAENEIETQVVSPVNDGNAAVSSSRIREMIEKGEVADACRLLGRPYSIYGKVNHGKKLGRTIGFPTANQEIKNKKVMPGDGVYLTRVTVDGKEYFGITDIGVKPTVGEHARGAETFIFGYNGDLYEKNIKTEFLECLRGEKKFESVEELKCQISADADKAKELIKTYEK